MKENLSVKSKDSTDPYLKSDKKVAVIDDYDSSSSEELDVTLQDVFCVNANYETNRNHPPNFKTESLVLDLCFHPQAEFLATGNIDGECIIYKYSLESVEEIMKLSHHNDSCRNVCYNSSGAYIYTVSKDGSLAVTDIDKSAVKIHIKDAHEFPINSFLEIDQNLCSTGDDEGIIKLWDLRKKKSIFEFKCGEEPVTSLLCCSQNKYLTATVSDGSLTGINLKKRELECQSEMFDSEFTCQELISREKRVVVGSSSGTLYIFKWGEFGFNVDALSGHPDSIQCMVPITENIIVTGCEDGNIRAVHLYDHRFFGIIGQHNFGVDNLALSHDGKLLASCSIDEEVQFWDISYLYERKVDAKRKSNKRFTVSANLKSSKRRDDRNFFKDIPKKFNDDDDGGPVPCTSYDSD